MTEFHILNRSQFKPEEISEVARFVCPRGVDYFNISAVSFSTFKEYSASKMHGRGIVSGICGGAATDEVGPAGRIYVAVHRSKTFPKDFRGQGASVRFADPAEVLVFVLAHELRHLWQRGRWNLTKHSKRACEVDANRYATKQLKRWRLYER